MDIAGITLSGREVQGSLNRIKLEEQLEGLEAYRRPIKHRIGNQNKQKLR
mgnify:CR=1 FL=1